MDGHRIEQAVHRIEAAMARVEAAAGKLGPDSGDDAGLQARHKALRDEVTATLKDLDQLIEGFEP